jgi:hypothetical protein
MPVTWEIRDRVLIVTLVRDWSRYGPAEAITEAMSSPHFEPGTSLLFDVRLSEVNPSGEEVRSRSQWLAGLMARGMSSRCAIVISPRVHQYGIARVASVYSDLQGMTVEIFSDLNQALLWLRTEGSAGAAAH